MEEKYTIGEVMEVLFLMGEEVICAIEHGDRESLEDILTESLGE